MKAAGQACPRRLVVAVHGRVFLAQLLAQLGQVGRGRVLHRQAQHRRFKRLARLEDQAGFFR